MGIFNEDVEVSEVRIGKIDDGGKYTTSIRGSGIADGSGRDLWVENPTGAGQDAYINMTFSPSALAQLTIAEDVAQDGAGNATTVINAKPSVGDNANVNTRTQDNYTINGSSLDFVKPGGSNAGAGAGGSSDTAAPTIFLLEEGTSMLFRLINRSGGNADLGISMAWFEVDL